MLAYVFFLVLVSLAVVDGQSTIYTTIPSPVVVATVYGPPASPAPAVAPTGIDTDMDYMKYYTPPAGQSGLPSLPPANAVPYNPAQTPPVQYAPTPDAPPAGAPASGVAPSPVYGQSVYAAPTVAMASAPAMPSGGSDYNPIDHGIVNSDGEIEISCTMEDHIVTISNIDYSGGEWWDQLKHSVKDTCSRHVKHYKFRKPSSDEDGSYATIQFKVKDVEPNLPCISGVINSLSGDQLHEQCHVYVPEGWNTGQPMTTFEPVTVSLNRWSDMKDKGHAEANYGLWEIYNISGWTTSDYKEGAPRPATHQEIFQRLHHVMEEAQDYGRIPDNPRHWRQFLDQNGRPAVYCGIYTSPEKVTKAISEASGLGRDQIIITSRDHEGKWDEWSKQYSPFKYHEWLPQSKQYEGLTYVDLGDEGYSSDGAMCQPIGSEGAEQQQCPFPIPGSPGYVDPSAPAQPATAPLTQPQYVPPQTYPQDYQQDPQGYPAQGYTNPQGYPPAQPASAPAAYSAPAAPAQSYPAQPAAPGTYPAPAAPPAQPSYQAQPVAPSGAAYPTDAYASAAPAAPAAPAA